MKSNIIKKLCEVVLCAMIFVLSNANRAQLHALAGGGGDKPPAVSTSSTIYVYANLGDGELICVGGGEFTTREIPKSFLIPSKSYFTGTYNVDSSLIGWEINKSELADVFNYQFDFYADEVNEEKYVYKYIDENSAITIGVYKSSLMFPNEERINIIPIFAENADVFQIGDTKYKTLKEALAALDPDNTTKEVKLLDDYDLTAETGPFNFGSSGTVYINLNSHILTADKNTELTSASLLCIKNGTIKSNGEEIELTLNCPTIIESGYFNINLKVPKDQSLKIKGGYFTADMSDYVDSGYKCIENDEDNNETYGYKVVEDNSKYTDGTSNYNDLATALSSIEAGGTIKVLKEAEEDNLDALLTEGKTLDLNGNNLIVNSMASIGGIIKDSADEKGSLTYVSNFAYLDKGFEKVEISQDSGTYINDFAYIPVKTAEKTYKFYEAKVGNTKRAKSTGYWTESEKVKCQAIVGSSINGDVDSILEVQNGEIITGVNLGLRVNVSDQKDDYTFSANIVEKYIENAASGSKPFFKFVGLDKDTPIIVNGFVFNDEVNYKYQGRSQTIKFDEIAKPAE